jgi:hypothetical protein
MRFGRCTVLDGSWYDLQRYCPKRQFLVDKLLPVETMASESTTPCLLYQQRSMLGILALIGQKSKWLRKWLSRIQGSRFIYEESIHHPAGELSQDYPEHRLVMVGSWQTTEHFQRSGKLFCNLIRPRFDVSNDYKFIAKTIKESRLPVSVHVRRGDFLRIGHGVHSPRYYRAAAEVFRYRAGKDPDWFVFSEDQEWCRTNLSFLGSKARFVTVNSPNAEIEELLLMKECRAGAIIANSSFSWWGAALGDEPGRPVIASRYRHGPGDGDVQTARLLPHWERVEEF